MDLDTHPNPQPDVHHRRIDLQSIHDLTYLQTNLANSAQQKLDLHSPKQFKPATHISLGANTSGSNAETQPKQDPDPEAEEEEDPMRRRVHDLITEFLTTTWTSAAPNISVNGIEGTAFRIPHTATLSPAPAQPVPTEPQPETEGRDFQYAPFDASLQHRLASLHGELETLTAQVSKLRRTAPAQGAEVAKTRLAQAMESDDAAFDGLEDEDMEGLNIEVVKDGWNQDVKEMYESGVRELVSLTGSGGDGARQGPTLTETVAKAQRARTAAMEMD